MGLLSASQRLLESRLSTDGKVEIKVNKTIHTRFNHSVKLAIQIKAELYAKNNNLSVETVLTMIG